MWQDVFCCGRRTPSVLLHLDTARRVATRHLLLLQDAFRRSSKTHLVIRTRILSQQDPSHHSNNAHAVTARPITSQQQHAFCHSKTRLVAAATRILSQQDARRIHPEQQTTHRAVERRLLPLQHVVMPTQQDMSLCNKTRSVAVICRDNVDRRHRLLSAGR